MRYNCYKPSPYECVLLLLALVAEREGRRGKKMTRAQISETTLRRLWNRERFTDGFREEVKDWMLSAGWALIDAGATYAAVRVDAVGNWPSLASSRIQDVLDKTQSGDFDFFSLRHLIAPAQAVSGLGDRDPTESSADEEGV